MDWVLHISHICKESNCVHALSQNEGAGVGQCAGVAAAVERSVA